MTRAEFNELFERLYSPLCNYAFAIVKSHDEAEDIVQAILVDFWNKEDKDQIEVKLDNYLIRAVKFKCIDYQRKAVVRRKYEAEALYTTAIADEEPEEENPKLKEVVGVAIAQLPEKTRQVFVMCKIDGKSYKEIADELKISPKTVENQMGRAFRHLRESLKDQRGLLMMVTILFMK
jgi:RNA polymerase sigma-70 factor (ECF subfamily)